MPKKANSKKSHNTRAIRLNKYKKISDVTKGKILAYWEDGKSQVKISHIIGVARATVGNIIRKNNQTGDVKRKVGSGRKRKTTKREDNIIVRTSKQDPFKSATQISEIISTENNINVSHDTVNRRLIEAGLPSYVARKKPFISDVNIDKRLQWCINHQYWTVHDWKRVLWCDESPFTLSYHGRTFVRRPKGKAYDKKYLKPTFKYGGGKIQVWGSFAANGVGDLYRINGTMVCVFLYVWKTLMLFNNLVFFFFFLIVF